jgi:hypothetical protein
MFATSQTASVLPTPVSDDWKSIFIPRIDFNMTREELIRIIEQQLCMGTVSRIDLAPAKDGSGRMAFVHMSNFNSTPEVKQIRDAMETNPFWDLPDSLNQYRIKIRFAINRNPVPKTDFTMETLADVITRQGYMMELFESRIRNLEMELQESRHRANYFESLLLNNLQMNPNL